MRWELLLVLLAACDSPKSNSHDAVKTTVSVSASVSAAPTATSDFYAPAASIDELVARLARSPVWNNGGFSAINLPENAPVEKIVARAVALVSSDEKSPPPHRILETRNVVIGGGPEYIACRVELGNGKRKIFLFQWMPSGHWWNRSWDAT